LVALDVTASTASFAVILTRVCTLWFAVVIGMVFMMMYARGSSEARHALGAR